ncbi:MAG: hypothetical protein JJE28_03045 [Actinomycetales bacterium]|nr:hypothetical protein [Actinomycetales bacterium]
MEPIISHYVAPIEMTRAEFRAISAKLDSDATAGIENGLDKMLADYAEAHKATS